MKTPGADVAALVTRAMRQRVAALPVVREFPWRATRDPWRVMVAEYCCQQTQARRAVDAYERVCARFASPAECAAAPLADVLDAWRGLGYYRRAKALHAAARLIVERHDGRVPDDLDALLALPGIGPYTARAILAFAFEHDVGVVDTNVGRVLSRAIANRSLSSRDAQCLADALVDTGRGWRHNQAMLDLGATRCTAEPTCAGCSLGPSCRWRRAGAGAPDPAKGSAGVSRRQVSFPGSDRQGRGRLLAAVLDGPVTMQSVATITGWTLEPDRARRVAADLCREGMLQETDGVLRVAEAGRTRSRP